MLLETFGTLLRDPNHWAFELLGMALFDGLIGAILWPLIKRHFHQDLHKVEEHEHRQLEAIMRRIMEIDELDGWDIMEGPSEIPLTDLHPPIGMPADAVMFP